MACMQVRAFSVWASQFLGLFLMIDRLPILSGVNAGNAFWTVMFPIIIGFSDSGNFASLGVSLSHGTPLRSSRAISFCSSQSCHHELFLACSLVVGLVFSILTHTAGDPFCILGILSMWI